MTDAPARPTTLDRLRNAFLKNAIRTGEQAFDPREAAPVRESDPAAEPNPRTTNKTKPAESRA